MNKYPCSYKTIVHQTETSFKEKGSVFIGLIYNISCIDDTEQILTDIKKKYYDATHHTFAYKLISGEEKYTDDGEPGGTAGIRILNAINKFELNNILISVIRYYGGTKLGVGPLGKAYYHSAEFTIENSKIVKKERYLEISISYNFEDTKHVHHFLADNNSQITGNDFYEKPVIKALIKPDSLQNLKSDLINATNNKAIIEISSKIIYQ